MTGTSVYNIVFNYLEHCKGKVVPFGGSIDAKKEGHEDYDKPWNPPGISHDGVTHTLANYFIVGADVKILVSQVAKELERKGKKKNPHEPPMSGIGARRSSEGHKSQKPRASSLPVVSKSSLPLTRHSARSPSVPIIEDEQTDYVNEGDDVVEDEIYENNEPEEVYLNTASRDDIYQNTPDICKTNVDSNQVYTNVSPNQPPIVRAKLPKATPRMPQGKQYINAAAERVKDVAYSDSSHYLKLQPDEPEEVYEPVDH